MKRRTLIKGIAAHSLFPTALASFHSLAANVVDNSEAKFFSQKDFILLRNLVDVILPATDTPAASEAKTHYFIDIVVRDCYTREQQRIFIQGLKSLDKKSQAKFNRPFIDVNAEQQHELLAVVEEQEIALPLDESFFKMLKDLALTGYFNSEIGTTRAQVYVHVPGRYEGCIPLKPGQKSWAT